MERRLLCSPTWDTMEYSNFNFQLPKTDSPRSSHDSYLDVAEGDSSACPHYTNHRTKSPHVLFQKVDSRLQSRERTINDHELISLQVLQYTSESPPVVVSQPREIKAKDVQAEDDVLHHKHQNRQSRSAAAASEEKPTAKVTNTSRFGHSSSNSVPSTEENKIADHSKHSANDAKKM